MTMNSDDTMGVHSQSSKMQQSQDIYEARTHRSEREERVDFS